MTAPFLTVVILLGVAAVTAMVIPIRRVVRTGGLRPSWGTPAELEDAYTSGPAPDEAPPRPRKASTPRGFRPPAHSDLRPMYVSEFCSGGACVLCPGNGCECTCMHNGGVIVDRCNKEYDRTHGKAPA